MIDIVWKVKTVKDFCEIMRQEYKTVMTLDPWADGALNRYTQFTSYSEQTQSMKALEDKKTKLTFDDVRYYINDYAARGDWSINVPKPDHLKIAVFGCSFTFGVGIDEEGTWHAQVKKLLKTDKPIQLINMGYPGGSISKSLKLFKYLTDVYEIDIAIFLLPTHWREEYPAYINKMGTSYHNFIPNVNPHGLLLQKWEEFYMFATEETQIYNAIKAVSHIDAIAQSKNIETYFSTWDFPLYCYLKSNYLTKNQLLPYYEFLENHKGIKDGFARDGNHPGPLSNEHFANQILEHLTTFSEKRTTKKRTKLI
jgi:hypothetical protein